MATPATDPNPRFDFSAGALCLDFVNTLPDRPGATQESLSGPADWIDWAQGAGILDRAQREQLQQLVARRPTKAEQAFRSAIALRENLYDLFSAVADKRDIQPEGLEALNAALAEALSHLELRPQASGVDWAWTGRATHFGRVLWPVARSAADLLTSDETGLIRECASGTCSWLFVDHSRTRRRRWCSMKSCGNRAKARRHYARTKQRRDSSETRARK